MIQHLNYPQYLSAQEMANPFSVINSFFKDFQLPEIKKLLASWMAAVNTPKIWKHKSPADLLDFYERQIQLIEATWLIQQMDNAGNPAIISSYQEEEQLMRIDLYCNPFYKQFALDFFPRVLSRKEYLNPYKVFPKFFKFYTLSEWKQNLYNALHLSLTNTKGGYADNIDEILKIEKFMVKVAEACHLIFVREEEAKKKLIKAINKEA